jgi:peptidoglycan/xylan/chitin deacetylase (PgdA/CDA1 family)
MMRHVTLMYHDVVPAGQPQVSGFPTGDAALYKLSVAAFRAHLSAIGAVLTPDIMPALADAPGHGQNLFLTFDDGGASFIDPIADLLEERGWRGHFFIATDFIGTPEFLTEAQIRALHRRGHLIGSHSCTHPLRMAACSREQLRREWSGSVRRLSDLLGTPVTVASVPGGLYSRAVAEAAIEAGIRVLFNSEPTTRVTQVDGCTILGRYAIRRDTPAGHAARFVRGDMWPRMKQSIGWKLRKLIKAAAGPMYLRVRQRLLQ